MAAKQEDSARRCALSFERSHKDLMSGLLQSMELSPKEPHPASIPLPRFSLWRAILSDEVGAIALGLVCREVRHVDHPTRPVRLHGRALRDGTGGSPARPPAGNRSGEQVARGEGGGAGRGQRPRPRARGPPHCLRRRGLPSL
jgi:hypothetical protein